MKTSSWNGPADLEAKPSTTRNAVPAGTRTSIADVTSTPTSRSSLHTKSDAGLRQSDRRYKTVSKSAKTDARTRDGDDNDS